MRLLGTLGFDWKIFLIQAVNFLVLFLILKKIFFRPFIQALQKEKEQQERLRRTEEVIEKEKLEWAREKEGTLQRMQEKFQKIIEEAEKTTQKIRNESEEKAILREKEILAKIQQRGKSIAKRYKREIERDYQENLTRKIAHFFQKQFSEKTLNLMQDSFWQNWIKKVKNLNIDKDLLVTEKGGKQLTVTINSAFPLNMQQKKELKKIIQIKTGISKIILKNKIKNRLLAGYGIVLGGLLAEKNLKNDLENLIL